MKANRSAPWVRVTPVLVVTDVRAAVAWEYGERQAGLIDPFGHGWVLTQTLRDVEPGEWGGETVVART